MTNSIHFSSGHHHIYSDFSWINTLVILLKVFDLLLFTKYQHLSNWMEGKIVPLFGHYIFIDSVIKVSLSSKYNSSLSVDFQQSTFSHWGETGMGIALWLKSTNNLKFHSSKNVCPQCQESKRTDLNFIMYSFRSLQDLCCHSPH